METMLRSSDLNFDVALTGPVVDDLGATVDQKPDATTGPVGETVVLPRTGVL